MKYLLLFYWCINTALYFCRQ